MNSVGTTVDVSHLTSSHLNCSILNAVGVVNFNVASMLCEKIAEELLAGLTSCLQSLVSFIPRACSLMLSDFDRCLIPWFHYDTLVPPCLGLILVFLNFGMKHSLFLARDVIYTSRAYATMSVSVSLSICL